MIANTQEQYDKLIEAERDLRDGVLALERERDFVRTEAARVAKPRGLGWAAASFGYLTMVGVIVPIVALAWRPVPSAFLSRTVLVSLFVSGLAAVGLYLIWAVRQLARPSNSSFGTSRPPNSHCPTPDRERTGFVQTFAFPVAFLCMMAAAKTLVGAI